MDLIESSSTIATVLEFAWKGIVVLLIAGAAAALLSRRSAAIRHLVWCSAMLALLAIPVVSSVVPDWETSLNVPRALSSTVSLSGPVDSEVSVVTDRDNRPANADLASDADAFVPGFEDKTIVAQPSAAQSVVSPIKASTIFFLVWVVGLVFVLLDIAVGHVAALRATRRALRVWDERILALMNGESNALNLSVPVDLRYSSDIAVPCTWGLVRPAILLPEEALRWSDDRLRMVLAHELGHIKRFDWLTLVLTHLACAVHWFNPLAWVARRCMIQEQEAATDDLVLQSGRGAAQDYASNLLDIARASVGARPRYSGLATATIAMSRRSSLEGRLLAILDSSRNRSSFHGKRVLATSALVIVFLIPLAAVQPHVVGSTPVATMEQDAALPPVESGVLSMATAELAANPGDNSTKPPIVETAPAGPVVSDSPSNADELVREDSDSTKVRLLLDALANETDAEVRVYLVRILGEMDNALATPGLTSVLVLDDSEEARAAAAWALGEIGDPSAVESLSSALENDTSVEVRRQVVRALGEIGSIASAPVLERALATDASADVRQYVAWALGELESPSSIDALETALGDESADVRLKAAWALGEINSERSAAALERILSDSSKEVRRYAAHALGNIGHASSVEPLLVAVRDEDVGVRSAAILALGEIGSPSAVDALSQALSDPDAEVRSRAAWSLAEIGSDTAADALMKAMKDDDPEVRRHVARALGEVKADKAADALMQMLRSDPDREVRKMAARALSNLDF